MFRDKRAQTALAMILVAIAGYVTFYSGNDVFGKLLDSYTLSGAESFMPLYSPEAPPF